MANCHALDAKDGDRIGYIYFRGREKTYKKRDWQFQIHKNMPGRRS